MSISEATLNFVKEKELEIKKQIVNFNNLANSIVNHANSLELKKIRNEYEAQ